MEQGLLNCQRLLKRSMQYVIFCSLKPWKCHNTDRWISFLFLVVCLAAHIPVRLPTASARYYTDFRSVISATNTIKHLILPRDKRHCSEVLRLCLVITTNSSLRNSLPTPVSYFPQRPVLTRSALLPSRRETKLEMLHDYKRILKSSKQDSPTNV
jgi:hypothetical protein